jgi:mRNA-degrading endonuclease YafQ of YafQ-DinJ toxin-antitoxin module
MIIEYSPEFRRLFKKLPKVLKLKAVEREKIFRADYQDPRLKTHKLSGKLEGRQAFWIDYHIRIIFSKIGSVNFYFHSIGGHDLYK